MKTIHRYIAATVLLIGLCTQGNLFAQQEVPFDKDYFKDRKDEFREAKKEYDAAMDLMKQVETNTDPAWSVLRNYETYHISFYREAMPHFEKAYAFNPNSSVVNYHLGKCYLAGGTERFKAVDFLLKAYQLNPSVSNDVLFFLGYAYHIQNNWKEAKKYYQLFEARFASDPSNPNKQAVMKKLLECNYGEKLTQNPLRVWIDNVGAGINTQYPEYAPLITADESEMIFTGRRDDTQKGDKDPQDGMYYEDVYEAQRDEKGVWGKAANLGPEINSGEHDAPAGLSPDGKTLFIFYGYKGSGDIYFSRLENNQYSKPEKLPNSISNNSSYESSASISYDGKELYFASRRQGGYGEEDIYMARWDEKKKNWGEPVNLGKVINTEHRETGVYLHPDGETLYFASEGHESMGGFDIFMSKRVNGEWTKPVNLGYPINSADDDVYFVVAGSGRYGYYASVRPEGYGATDIYRITFLGPEKPPITSSEDNLLANYKPVREVRMEEKVEITTASLVILKGIIRDEKTKLPLSATIEIVDNEKNELVATFSSDGKTGAYLVSVPSGKNYGIAVKCDGYLFHSENIAIPKSSGYREYQKDIDLKKIDVGEVIVLRNIFYDFDKATLRSESTNELERLIKLLTDNPTIRIELSSHTDSRGDDAYNQRLSEARAKSVVDYLVEHGIAISRLEYKGYGESDLLVSDSEIAQMKTKTEREEAHQQNRRTEFKILSK